MIDIKLVSVITSVLLILLFSYSLSEDVKKMDLKSLEGNWEGNGEFLMPATDIAVSIAGKAQFQYDSTGGYLRTALTGEKFLFTYSDSGHLYLDGQTDSIHWEVWDNFGKHAKYSGMVEGNTITGKRYHKQNLYRVIIEIVSKDSIDFKLTITDPKGVIKDKATFNLWRVKE